MIVDQLRESNNDAKQDSPQHSIEVLSDTKRSFIPPPTETSTDVKQIKSDEINIKLNLIFNSVVVTLSRS